MRLSATELRRQKEKRVQQIEDFLCLILFGYAVFVSIGFGIGKLAANLQHHYGHMPLADDYKVVAGVVILAALFAGSIVLEPVKKLFYERSVLKTELAPATGR